MPPTDPGDFLAAEAGAPVAPPYRADAAAVNLRFQRLYDWLTATTTGVDTTSIKDQLLGPASPYIETQQAWQTTALSGATWTPANLEFYKDSIGIVHFKAISYTASADLANGTTFGTMPAGYRPGFQLYIPAVRNTTGAAFGSCSFWIDTDGTLRANHNFQPSTSPGISFAAVEYLAEA